MHWALDDIPAILIIVGATLFASGLLYIGMNANYLYSWWRGRHAPRAHGPWCVTATRPPFGTQIIHQANTRSTCIRWRNRNRAEFPGPLAVLSRDEVDRRNAELLASPQYWRLMYVLSPYVDEAVDRAAALPSDYTTPITTVLTIPSIAQARWVEHIDRLIEDSQLLSDSVRTLKRRIEVPNE